MSAPGFYGKLACRGDFVTRDLAPGFTQPWDAWLCEGIQASRQQLGEDWLSAYLVSPLWRFALAAGVCGPNAVLGMLMPSIDRVGRYFPLTVAQILEPGQSVASVAGGAAEWYDVVEKLMLSTLDQGAGFGVFEVALTRVPPISVLPRSAASRSAGLQIFSASDFQARQLELTAIACEGASLWWGNDAEGAAQGLVRCKGLPDPQRFGSHLLGKGTVA
jgi:type VI secretion system protein ImpM